LRADDLRQEHGLELGLPSPAALAARPCERWPRQPANTVRTLSRRAAPAACWPAWPLAASRHRPRRPRPARLPARHHPAPLQRWALDLPGVSHRLGVA